MAPKKAPQSKAAVKQREKAVEDKTFGIKNKKGAKGQKFVQQVKQNIDATANKGQRGPTKKELKEAQKAQEAEMLALFNAVPKGDGVDGGGGGNEDLDADKGPTFTDITQEIEYQRANVVAKTKITDDVFRAWRDRKVAARREEAAAGVAERRRRGLLTGREIFLEASGAIIDDEGAGGLDEAEMAREVDEEAEIERMRHLSLEAQRSAWAEAGMEVPAAAAQLGPSSVAASAAAGCREEAAVAATGPAPRGEPPLGSTVAAAPAGIELTADEAAVLADESDDDIDLDELERQVAAGS